MVWYLKICGTLDSIEKSGILQIFFHISECIRRVAEDTWLVYFEPKRQGVPEWCCNVQEALYLTDSLQHYFRIDRETNTSKLAVNTSHFIEADACDYKPLIAAQSIPQNQTKSPSNVIAPARSTPRTASRRSSTGVPYNLALRRSARLSSPRPTASSKNISGGMVMTPSNGGTFPIVAAWQLLMNLRCSNRSYSTPQEREKRMNALHQKLDIPRLDNLLNGIHDVQLKAAWRRQRRDEAMYRDTVVFRMKEEIQAASKGRGSTADDCSICYVTYDPGAVCRQLKCRHVYHMSCIDQSLEMMILVRCVGKKWGCD
ncbi:Similar to RING finger protein 148; acc. no. Q2TA44 [Pyronema omphalodes CBS 100304]|uniref:Similar to RING finger protein 148 acc. no. Q2TA44 n=1 Tax=Pyronema omphalodes (strain CBS 100304) TaxID=1076935 RepID=U4KWZ7_PYROM|nr:Similar to RING finger protein 148; acc. no. Q2TA44 [Pyronema omphalodes CBS 100304]